MAVNRKIALFDEIYTNPPNSLDRRYLSSKWTDNSRVEDFGAKLRRLRLARGVKTQIALARQALEDVVGAPDIESLSNHISRVERGEETNPSLEFIERAARGLKLTIAEFFAGLEGGAPATSEERGRGGGSALTDALLAIIDQRIAVKAGATPPEVTAGETFELRIPLTAPLTPEQDSEVRSLVHRFATGQVDAPGESDAPHHQDPAERPRKQG